MANFSRHYFTGVSYWCTCWHSHNFIICLPSLHSKLAQLNQNCKAIKFLLHSTALLFRCFHSSIITEKLDGKWGFVYKKYSCLYTLRQFSGGDLQIQDTWLSLKDIGRVQEPIKNKSSIERTAYNRSVQVIIFSGCLYP